MDKLENNLNRIHEWIKAVDQKVSIFLAFQGITLTLLLPNLGYIFDIDTCTSTYKVFLGMLGIVFLFLSCHKSIMAIIPKIKKSGDSSSFTFFGDIADITLEKFRDTIKEAKPEDYENEFINQIYISAKIANNKHVLFREAIITFIMSVFILIVYFLI